MNILLDSVNEISFLYIHVPFLTWLSQREITAYTSEYRHILTTYTSEYAANRHPGADSNQQGTLLLPDGILDKETNSSRCDDSAGRRPGFA
jgi:hypothetical protein